MAGKEARVPMVALRGITKRFGAFTANDGIDLTIQPGEIHALLGENGAGKSTLVKILYGLLQPDEGEIALAGETVRLHGPADARARGIGMVFQHFSLFENLTVLENIALGVPGAKPDDALRARVETIERDYGLTVAPQRPVWTLSAGERQRIEILRCLLQEPRLLVLDEPTSVLTPAESETLFATLQSLVAQGTSVLFISHKLDEVRRHCTRATILRRGKVVAVLDPRHETARSLAQHMVGEAVGDVATKPHAPGDILLELRGVSLQPEDPHAVALRTIHLSVRAGEIVAVAGIAGNGQSELFAVISGEALPKAGTIEIASVDVTRVPVGDRRALAAAFVPEERLGHAAVPGARLSDNLLLTWSSDEKVVRRGLIDWRAVRSFAQRIRQGFDVRASGVDPEARRLSGGNLQKYVMGREIIRAPQLLVVNQPSWGIDAAAARAIRQALIDQVAAGAAVLMISQDLDEIFEIADRIAVIAHGELSAAQPTRETTREAVGLLMMRARAEAGQEAA